MTALGFNQTPMSAFLIPVLYCLSINMMKITSHKLLMNDSAFTFRENINLQCHLILRPKEETKCHFMIQVIEKHFWGRGFF